MANPVWPPSLPQSQFVGLNDQFDESGIRTPTDGGPAKVRARYTSIPRKVMVPIVLYNAQRITFDDFYRNTIFAVNPFEWEDPVDDDLVVFRFLAAPRWSMGVGSGGRTWSATMELEILP